MARDRPLCAGDDTRPAARPRAVAAWCIEAGSAGALRPLRVPSGRAGPADFLLRGSGRLLSRHPQGPALHDAGGLARAALGAERALSHHAIADTADGADSLFYGGGGVGSAGGWGNERVRADLVRLPPAARCRPPA